MCFREVQAPKWCMLSSFTEISTSLIVNMIEPETKMLLYFERYPCICIVNDFFAIRNIKKFRREGKFWII